MKRLLRKVRAASAAVRRVRNWHTMIFDHLHLVPEGPVTYRLRSGETFAARAKTYDVNAIEEVWVFRVYTPPGFEIGPSDTVIDVGAHIGSFTVFAARQAKAGRVFAFEPTDENFGRLQINIASNGLTNVTATKAAVAGSAGLRQMFIQQGDHVGHSLYPIGPNAGEATVETTTLEDCCIQHDIKHINFLKLDCEGAEFDILQNAPDSLLEKIDKISMEFHLGDGRDPEQLIRFLTSKGFHVSTDKEQMYAIRRAS